jgi:hypothetical protein
MGFRTYRKPHILTKRIATQLPSNLLFFDTETRDKYRGRNKLLQRHEFWFGAAIYVSLRGEHIETCKPFELNSVDDFWKLLGSKLSKDKPLYLFAHNLTFDLTIIDFWNRHENEGYETTYAVLENPPMFLALKKDGKKLCIVDTFNYWKQPLAAIGKSLGFEKLPMPTSKTVTKEWRRYCLRDVEILQKQIINLFQFLRSQELGSFKISAPGLAFGTFRKRFMKHDVYIHDRNKVLELERAAYSGGMVRNFFLGKITNETIYKYDVNSLYPAMMLNKYPVKLLEDMQNEAPNKLLKLLPAMGAVAHVRMKVYDRTYPKRFNNRLCEVSGRFSAYLCGEELYQALRLGHVEKVLYAAIYDVDFIFHEYVTYFWNLRKQYQAAGDRVNEQFVKLLMNSLYGRFGMRGHKWVDFTNKNLEDYYTYFGSQCPPSYIAKDFSPIVNSFRHKWYAEGLDDPITLRYYSGRLEMQFPTGEHSESFCAISAFVTSYAREELRRLITIAGVPECYYCDTDSLFVSELGSKRLLKAKCVDPTALGKLKLEGISKNTVFYGPKDYEFNGEFTMKGIRKNAVQIGVSTYEQDSFEGLKSVLNRGGEPHIDIRKIQKTLQRKLLKGVLKDQGRVTPLILNEQF